MNKSTNQDHKVYVIQSKQFILLLCLSFFISQNPIFAQSNQAQDESVNNNFKAWTIQGGLFSDFGVDNFWGKEFNINYASFNKLGLGIIKFETNKLSQTNLGFSYYKKDFQFEKDNQFTLGLKKTKLAIELEHFISLLKREEFSNKLHLGPVLSCAYFHDENTPIIPEEFSIVQNSFLAGLGIKTFYAIPIAKSSHLFFSTEIIAFDMSIDVEERTDPMIDQELRRKVVFGDLDILRPRFGLDFGIVF